MRCDLLPRQTRLVLDVRESKGLRLLLGEASSMAGLLGISTARSKSISITRRVSWFHRRLGDRTYSDTSTFNSRKNLPVWTCSTRNVIIISSITSQENMSL